MRQFKGRVIQVLPNIVYGDGVGNDALAIDAILKKNGYKTGIYAEVIDERLPKGIALNVNKMQKTRRGDIIIYHLSTGSKLNYLLPEWEGHKIIIYHNITPDYFFEKYNVEVQRNCIEGRKGLENLRNTPGYCIADSEYNKSELIDSGYSCKIDVLPIVIPFEDYQKKPNENVIKRYAGDGYTNILFTGRIVPNKKQEDVIAAFHYYQKFFNPKSRLFLVGSFVIKNYYNELRAYVKALGVNNVIFTGHIPFDEILAYYTLSDLFLCLSEHEGFCIPLVEAMIFKIPIVAFQSTGVTGTMGDGGFPVKLKNPLEIAGIMHYIQTHQHLRQELVRKGQEQLLQFEPWKVEKQFLAYLETFIGEFT